MHFLAFATDYDGTLASDGHVSATTLDALREVKRSGRSLLLVTGRERRDLLQVFPDITLFDFAVLENGAVLYDPATRVASAVVQPPPDAFFDQLRARHIPYARGEVICATAESDAHAVFDVIHELGVELQVIFNKGSAMVLPSGVNKATGLQLAADRLGLSRHNIVAAGDAENDHVFLSTCHIGVAVANALPSLKASADHVTRLESGDGIREFVTEQLMQDCRAITGWLTRHAVAVGIRDDGTPVRLVPDQRRALIVGAPSRARSALVHAITKGLISNGYRLLVVDTDGDLTTPTDVAGLLRIRASLGASVRDELHQALGLPSDSVAVDLSWLDAGAMTVALDDVMHEIEAMQSLRGIPHWVILSNAHRVTSAVGRNGLQALARSDASVAWVTSWPEALPKELLMPTQSVWLSDAALLAPTLRTLASGRAVNHFELLPASYEAVCVDLTQPTAVAVEPFRFVSGA